jgi:nitroreductase
LELEQAIQKRRSVRGFLDRPVEKTVVDEILTQAVRAPSWGNTQPWEIAVAAGARARALTAEFVENAKSGVPANPDFEMPSQFPDIQMARYRTVGRELFRRLGIGRDDHEARLEHLLKNFEAFDAPVLIFLLLDQELSTVYPVFDSGLLAQNICLLAAERGLGTCLLAALAHYPDSVRRQLDIDQAKRVLLGIGLGYEDESAPANKLRTIREQTDRTVTWVGFED